MLSLQVFMNDKHKKDVFMSAQQALDYKLIDKIL